MKLHLPSGLRKALLACIATLAAHSVPVTVAAGTLATSGALVSFLLSQQAEASTTYTDGIEYSGDIWTYGNNGTSGLGSASGKQWSVEGEGGAQTGSGFYGKFWGAATNSAGNTLRLSGAEADVVQTTDWSGNFVLGGLIADDSEGVDITYTFGRSNGNGVADQSITFNAGEGTVYVSLKESVDFWTKSVTLASDGDWKLGAGTTFNFTKKTRGDVCNFTINANKTLTLNKFDGEGDGGVLSMDLDLVMNAGSKLTINEGITLNLTGGLSAASATVSVNGGSLTLSGAVNIGTLNYGGGSITLNGAGDITLSSLNLSSDLTLALAYGSRIMDLSTLTGDGTLKINISDWSAAENDVYTLFAFSGDGSFDSAWWDLIDVAVVGLGDGLKLVKLDNGSIRIVSADYDEGFVWDGSDDLNDNLTWGKSDWNGAGTYQNDGTENVSFAGSQKATVTLSGDEDVVRANDMSLNAAGYTFVGDDHSLQVAHLLFTDNGATVNFQVDVEVTNSLSGTGAISMTGHTLTLAGENAQSGAVSVILMDSAASLSVGGQTLLGGLTAWAGADSTVSLGGDLILGALNIQSGAHLTFTRSAGLTRAAAEDTVWVDFGDGVTSAKLADMTFESGTGLRKSGSAQTTFVVDGAGSLDMPIMVVGGTLRIDGLGKNAAGGPDRIEVNGDIVVASGTLLFDGGDGGADYTFNSAITVEAGAELKTSSDILTLKAGATVNGILTADWGGIFKLEDDITFTSTARVSIGGYQGGTKAIQKGDVDKDVYVMFDMHGRTTGSTHDGAYAALNAEQFNALLPTNWASDDIGLGITGNMSIAINGSGGTINRSLKIAQGSTLFIWQGENWNLAGKLAGEGTLVVQTEIESLDSNKWIKLSQGGSIGTLRFNTWGGGLILGDDLVVGALAADTDPNGSRRFVIKSADDADASLTLDLSSNATAKKVQFMEGLTLVKKGTATQTLENATIDADVQIEAGTLSLTGASTSASGEIRVNSGTLSVAGVVDLSGSSLIVNGGSLALNHGTNLGNLTLNAASGNKLTIKSAITINGSVEIAEGLTLQFDTGNEQGWTIKDEVSGEGSLYVYDKVLTLEKGGAVGMLANAWNDSAIVLGDDLVIQGARKSDDNQSKSDGRFSALDGKDASLVFDTSKNAIDIHDFGWQYDGIGLGVKGGNTLTMNAGTFTTISVEGDSTLALGGALGADSLAFGTGGGTVSLGELTLTVGSITGDGTITLANGGHIADLTSVSGSLSLTLSGIELDTLIGEGYQLFTGESSDFDSWWDKLSITFSDIVDFGNYHITHEDGLIRLVANETPSVLHWKGSDGKWSMNDDDIDWASSADDEAKYACGYDKDVVFDANNNTQASIELDGPVSVMNVTVEGNYRFVIGDGDSFSTMKDLTVSSGAALTLYNDKSSDGYVAVTGNLNLSGLLTVDGVPNASVGGSLNVGGDATLDLTNASSLQIGGLDLDSHTLTLKGNGSVNHSAEITLKNGTLSLGADHADASVQWMGALTLSGSSVLEVRNSSSVTGAITLDGGSLSLYDTASVASVNGTGNILVGSGTNTANLTGGGTIDGALKFNQYGGTLELGANLSIGSFEAAKEIDDGRTRAITSEKAVELSVTGATDGKTAYNIVIGENVTLHVTSGQLNFDSNTGEGKIKSAINGAVKVDDGAILKTDNTTFGKGAITLGSGAVLDLFASSVGGTITGTEATLMLVGANTLSGDVNVGTIWAAQWSAPTVTLDGASFEFTKIASSNSPSNNTETRNANMTLSLTNEASVVLNATNWENVKNSNVSLTINGTSGTVVFDSKTTDWTLGENAKMNITAANLTLEKKGSSKLSASAAAVSGYADIKLTEGTLELNADGADATLSSITANGGALSLTSGTGHAFTLSAVSGTLSSLHLDAGLSLSSGVTVGALTFGTNAELKLSGLSDSDALFTLSGASSALSGALSLDVSAWTGFADLFSGNDTELTFALFSNFASYNVDISIVGWSDLGIEGWSYSIDESGNLVFTKAQQELPGTLYWKGTDGTWSNDAEDIDWAGSADGSATLGFAANSVVVFGETTEQQDVALDGDITVGGMTVQGDYAFTLGGKTLTISGEGLTVDEGATVTLGGGSVAFTGDAGLTLDGTLVLKTVSDERTAGLAWNAATAITAGENACIVLDFSGAIRDDGRPAVSSYIGTTYDKKVELMGRIFSHKGSQVFSEIVVHEGAQLFLDGDYAGAVSISGMVSEVSNGNADYHTQGHAQEGALRLGGGVTFSGTLTLNDDAAVTVHSGQTGTISGSISSADGSRNALYKHGEGTLNISGSISNISGIYTRQYVHADGTAHTGAGNGGALNISGSVAVGGDSDTFTFGVEHESKNITLTDASKVTGAAAITKTGAGTLNLNGDMGGFTGSFTVSAGTVAFNATNTTQLSALTVDDGSFNFGSNFTGSFTFGSLTLNGGTFGLGSLTGLEVKNALTLNGMSLDASKLKELSAGALTLSNNGALTIGAYSASLTSLTVTDGGIISLAKEGHIDGLTSLNGTLTLTLTGFDEKDFANDASYQIFTAGSFSETWWDQILIAIDGMDKWENEYRFVKKADGSIALELVVDVPDTLYWQSTDGIWMNGAEDWTDEKGDNTYLYSGGKNVVFNTNDADSPESVTLGSDITAASITVNGNYEFIMQNALTVTGDLTIAEGATLTVGSGAGAFTFDGDGGIKLDGTLVLKPVSDERTATLTWETALPTITAGDNARIVLDFSGAMRDDERITLKTYLGAYDKHVELMNKIFLIGTGASYASITVHDGAQLQFDSANSNYEGTIYIAGMGAAISNGGNVLPHLQGHAQEGALRLNGSTLSGHLYLTDDAAVTVHQNQNGTIAADIAGSDGRFGFYKHGEGTLNLTGAISNISGMYVRAYVDGDGNAHTGAGNGGTLNISGSLAVGGDSDTFTFGVEHASKSITLTSDGSLTGSAAITKTGAGTLNLNGDMSGFTGSFTVSAGTLSLGSGTSTEADITVNGGTLVLAGNNELGDVTFNGGSWTSAGAGVSMENLTINSLSNPDISFGTADNKWSVTVTVNDTLTIGKDAVFSTTGSTFNKLAGAGTLYVEGTTTISGGGSIGTLYMRASGTTLKLGADLEVGSIYGRLAAGGTWSQTIQAADGAGLVHLILTSTATQPGVTIDTSTYGGFLQLYMSRTGGNFTKSDNKVQITTGVGMSGLTHSFNVGAAESWSNDFIVKKGTLTLNAAENVTDASAIMAEGKTFTLGAGGNLVLNTTLDLSAGSLAMREGAGTVTVNAGGKLKLGSGLKLTGEIALNGGALELTGALSLGTLSLGANGGTLIVGALDSSNALITGTSGLSGALSLDVSAWEGFADLFSGAETEHIFALFSGFGSYDALTLTIDGWQDAWTTAGWSYAIDDDGRLVFTKKDIADVPTGDTLVWTGAGDATWKAEDDTKDWLNKELEVTFGGDNAANDGSYSVVFGTEAKEKAITLSGDIKVNDMTVEDDYTFTTDSGTLTVNGTLSIAESKTATFDGNSEVSLAGLEGAGALALDKGSLALTNGGTIGGLALKDGTTVSMGGALNVGTLTLKDASGTYAFSKASGVTDTVTVTITNALTINGQKLNFTGLDVAINGLLTIGGTGSLNVDGSLTLNTGVADNDNNRIHIYGPANQEGDADTWAPTLSVAQDLTIATGALWICSGSSNTHGDTNVEVGNDLTVTGGGLVVGGSGSAKSRLHVGGDVSLGGNIHTKPAGGNASTDVAKIGTGGGTPNGGYLVVDGSLTSAGAGTFVVGDANSLGVVTIGKDMTLAGALNIVGSTTYKNSVTVGNNLTATGNITVGGNGTLTVKNDLTVSGTTTVGGTLTVNGNATLSGDLVMDSGVFRVTAHTNDAGEVDNSLTLTGSTRIGNTWSTGNGAYTSQLITEDGVDVIILGNGVVNMNGGKGLSDADNHVHFTVGGALQAASATLNLMATEVILKQGGLLGTLNIAAVTGYHTTIALGGNLEISDATIGDTGASFSRYEADATPDTVYVVWNAGTEGKTLSVDKLGLSGVTLGTGVELAKKGTGTLTLSDAGTIASNFRVMQGAVALAAGDTTFSGALTLDAGTSMVMGSTGILSVGSLMGSGTIALGDLRVSGGWLQITGEGSKGTIALDLSGFDITDAGSYDLFSDFGAIQEGWLAELSFKLTGYDTALWSIVYNAQTGQLDIVSAESKSLVWKGLDTDPDDGYIWAATGDTDLEWTNSSGSASLAYDGKNDGTYNVSFTTETADSAIAVSGSVAVNNMTVDGSYTFTGAEGDSITVGGTLSITSGMLTLNGLALTVEEALVMEGSGSAAASGNTPESATKLTLTNAHLTLKNGGSLKCLTYTGSDSVSSITLGADLSIQGFYSDNGNGTLNFLRMGGVEDMLTVTINGPGGAVPSTTISFGEGVNAVFNWVPGNAVSGAYSAVENMKVVGLNVGSGSLKVGKDLTSTSLFTLSGTGTVTVGGNMSSTALTLSGNGTMTVSGDLSVTGELKVNSAGTVTVGGDLTAGSISMSNAGGTLDIAKGVNVSGTVNISGSSYNTTLRLRSGGSLGTVTMASSKMELGGDLTIADFSHAGPAQFNLWKADGDAADKTVTLTITANGANADNVWCNRMFETGEGVNLVVNAESAKTGGTTALGGDATLNAKLTMSAGTFTVEGELTAKEIDFTGGTLTANGGGTITTLSGTGNGSLVVGAGSTLAITNTTASLGSLALNGTLQLGSNEGKNALTLNALTLGEGATLALTGLDSSTALLSLGSGVTLTDASLKLDLSGWLDLNDLLTGTADIEFALFGGLDSYDGLTITGLDAWSGKDGWSVAFDEKTGKLVFSYNGTTTPDYGDTLVWTDAGDTTWKAEDDTKDWTNNGNDVAFGGDNAENDGSYNVVFGSEHTGTITVEGDVKVKSMTVEGTYTFNGSDSIEVGEALTVTGAATFGVDTTVQGDATIASATVNGGKTLTVNGTFSATNMTLTVDGATYNADAASQLVLAQGGEIGTLDIKHSIIRTGSDLKITTLNLNGRAVFEALQGKDALVTIGSFASGLNRSIDAHAGVSLLFNGAVGTENGRSLGTLDVTKGNVTFASDWYLQVTTSNYVSIGGDLSVGGVFNMFAGAGRFDVTGDAKFAKDATFANGAAMSIGGTLTAEGALTVESGTLTLAKGGSVGGVLTLNSTLALTGGTLTLNGSVKGAGTLAVSIGSGAKLQLSDTFGGFTDGKLTLSFVAAEVNALDDKGYELFAGWNKEWKYDDLFNFAVTDGALLDDTHLEIDENGFLQLVKDTTVTPGDGLVWGDTDVDGDAASMTWGAGIAGWREETDYANDGKESVSFEATPKNDGTALTVTLVNDEEVIQAASMTVNETQYTFENDTDGVDRSLEVGELKTESEGLTFNVDVTVTGSLTGSGLITMGKGTELTLAEADYKGTLAFEGDNMLTTGGDVELGAITAQGATDVYLGGTLTVGTGSELGNLTFYNAKTMSYALGGADDTTAWVEQKWDADGSVKADELGKYTDNTGYKKSGTGNLTVSEGTLAMPALWVNEGTLTLAEKVTATGDVTVTKGGTLSLNGENELGNVTIADGGNFTAVGEKMNTFNNLTIADSTDAKEWDQNKSLVMTVKDTLTLGKNVKLYLNNKGMSVINTLAGEGGLYIAAGTDCVTTVGGGSIGDLYFCWGGAKMALTGDLEVTGTLGSIGNLTITHNLVSDNESHLILSSAAYAAKGSYEDFLKVYTTTSPVSGSGPSTNGNGGLIKGEFTAGIGIGGGNTATFTENGTSWNHNFKLTGNSTLTVEGTGFDLGGNKLIVTDGSTLNLNTALDLSKGGSLIVTEGSKLTLNTQLDLSVGGTLTMEGTLDMGSAADLVLGAGTLDVHKLSAVSDAKLSGITLSTDMDALMNFVDSATGRLALDLSGLDLALGTYTLFKGECEDLIVDLLGVDTDKYDVLYEDGKLTVAEKGTLPTYGKELEWVGADGEVWSANDTTADWTNNGNDVTFGGAHAANDGNYSVRFDKEHEGTVGVDGDLLVQNMVVDGAYTFAGEDGDDSITVGGTLSVTEDAVFGTDVTVEGMLDAEKAGLTLTGDGGLTLKGGSENSVAGSVVFDYADGDAGSGLEVTDGAGLTLGTIVEQGAQSGAVSLTEGGSLTLTGDSSLDNTMLTGDGSGSLTVAEDGSLTLAGAAGIADVNTAVDGTLTVTDGAGVTGEGSLDVKGNLALSNGGSIDLGHGDINIADGGMLTVSDAAAGSKLATEGELTLDGVLDLGSSAENSVGSLSGSGKLAGATGSELTVTGDGVFSGTLDGSALDGAAMSGGGTLNVGGNLTLRDAKSTEYVWNANVSNGGKLTVDMQESADDLNLNVTLNEGSGLEYLFSSDNDARLRGDLKVKGSSDLSVVINGNYTPDGDIELGLNLTEGSVSSLHFTLDGVIGRALEGELKVNDDGSLSVGKVQKAQKNIFRHPGMAKNTAAGADMLWEASEYAWAHEGDLQNFWMTASLTTALGGSVDRPLAGMAGASLSVLGSAISHDMHRQLSAIRTRTTAMGADVQAGSEPVSNVWMNAETGYHKLNNDGMAPGYSLNSWGGTVGVDVTNSDNVTVGLAITAMYGDLKADAADTLKGDMDTMYVSGFARMTSGAWTHTVVLSGGVSEVNLDRTVNYGGGSYATHGKTDGYSVGALYELCYAGYVSEDKSLVVLPVANVELRHGVLKGFTEKGSDAGLRVDDISQTALTFGAGARLQALLGNESFNGGALVESRVLVKVDALDGTSKADTRLINGALKREVESAKVGAVGVEIGVGVSMPLGQGSIFADASVELRSGYTNVDANVGYRVSF